MWRWESWEGLARVREWRVVGRGERRERMSEKVEGKQGAVVDGMLGLYLPV